MVSTPKKKEDRSSRSRSRTPSPSKRQASPAKKEVKPKKPRAKPADVKKSTGPPTTNEMVKAAIEAIGGRKGASISAIKKYISANYKVDLSKRLCFIKQYLRKASMEGGELKRLTGVGGNGSFKINKEAIKKPAKKNVPAKKESAKNTNNSSSKNANNNRARSASKSAKRTSVSKSKPRSSSKKATPKKRPSSSKKKSPAKRKSLGKGASKPKVKKASLKPKSARPKSSKGKVAA